MMNNPQVIVALNNISKISGGKRTLLRPDVVAKVAEAIGYPTPVKDATPLLTPAFRNNPMVFPSDEIKRLMGLTSARLGIKIRQQGWEVVPAGAHDYRGSKPKTSTQCTSQDRTR